MSRPFDTVHPVSHRKALALAGVIGPPVYFFTIFVIGMIRPGYHFATQLISQLTQPSAPFQPELTALFTAFNALSVLFSLRVLEWVHDRREWRGLGYAGAAMMLVVAIAGAVRVGFFPMDPLGTAPTPRGLAHLGLAGLSSVAAVAAQIVIGAWCIYARRTNRLGIYSTASGLALFIAVVLTGGAAFMGLRYTGLLEKVGVLVYLQWMFVLAIWLYRRS